MSKPVIHRVNGYTILFITSKNKTAYVSAIIANGYCNEEKSDIGINHLLEHVLFESWKKCKQKSCELYWMSKPVFFNGFTTMTQMKFFIDGMSDELPGMLEYIIDIVTQPLILQKGLTAEKKIVINEMNQRINSSYYGFNQIVLNALYTLPGLQQANNYLLQKKNVENISLKDLVEYHKQHYTPSTTYFVVSGDFNEAHVLSVFKNKLKATTPSSLSPVASSNIPSKNPFSYQSKLFFVQNKTDEAKNGGVEFNLYFPMDIHMNNELLQQLLITCSIIEKELYNILRIYHELIYSISVKYATYYYGSVVEITGSCTDSNIVKILKYIIAYLRDKKTKDVDQTLVNNVKKLLLLYRHNHIKNPMEIAEFYESQYILNQLQQRYRSPDAKHSQQNNTAASAGKACKIYSETEFDKALERVNAKHIRKIINIMDFSSMIIGYMGKKNLHLNLSDFI
jgi:predicted Zn-dependent peptidase